MLDNETSISDAQSVSLIDTCIDAQNFLNVFDDDDELDELTEQMASLCHENTTPCKELASKEIALQTEPKAKSKPKDPNLSGHLKQIWSLLENPSIDPRTIPLAHIPMRSKLYIVLRRMNDMLNNAEDWQLVYKINAEQTTASETTAEKCV